MVLAVLYDAVAADETNFQSLAVAVAYNRSWCNGVGNAGTCALGVFIAAIGDGSREAGKLTIPVR